QLLLVLLDDDVHVAAVRGLPLADGEQQVPLDVLDLVPVDVQVLVLVDHLALVAALLAVLLPADDQVAVVNDPLHAVVLDADVLVALGVDEDLLLALLVLETDLVIAGAAGRGVGLDVALVLLVGQLVSGHLLGVEDAADDDRLVGVAFQETDQHLLADARDVQGAPLLAGPGRGDADPAGAFGVALALAVP